MKRIPPFLILFAIFLLIIFGRGIFPWDFLSSFDGLWQGKEKRFEEEAPLLASGIVRAPGPLVVPDTKLNALHGTLTRAGIFDQTNKERAKQSLPPFASSPALDEAAEAKLDDMFARQYFEHDSPDGRGVGDLASSAGYSYIAVGENLALGSFEGDPGVVQAWMESPGHRANILSPGFEEIGIAAKKGLYQGRETWMAVQHFGRPLSSCPAVPATEKEAIEEAQEDFFSLEAVLLDSKRNLEKRRYRNRAEYEEAVAAYDLLVGELEYAAERLQGMVDLYNARVRAFNQCVAGGEE